MDIPALQDAVDACMTAIVEEQRAVGVYAIDKCVQPDAVDTVYIANGCSGSRLLVELEGTYLVRILDCLGRELSRSRQTFDGITAIPVPGGGLAILTR